MALIQCPECKTEISDKALTCPKCGAPREVQKVPQAPPAPLETLPAEKPGTFWQLFFGMFLKPRNTVRSITRYKSGYMLWPMLLIPALSVSLKPNVTGKFMEIVPFRIPYPGPLGLLETFFFIFAGVAVFIGVYISSQFLIGRLFGGRGSFKDVFTALVWAGAPGIMGDF